MSQTELIQRAKQGEAAAIARLLHLSLYTRGIRVKAHRAHDRLQILLEAHQFPDRHQLVDFIHRGIARLQSNAFKTVEIYARHPDTTQFIWCDGFDIRLPQPQASDGLAPHATGQTSGPLSTPHRQPSHQAKHAQVTHTHTTSHQPSVTSRADSGPDTFPPVELGRSASLSPTPSTPSASSSVTAHSQLAAMSPQEIAHHARVRLSMQQASQQANRRQHPTNDLGWMLVDKLRGVNPFAIALIGILALHSLFGSRHYTPEGFIAARDPMMMFLHNVNLIIHEAGHPIFGILGQFMGLLGGSLMQVLVPGVIAGYFLFTRQNYAWAIALWWTGQSILDVSLYIKDAQERALPLLGGEAVLHDWHFLLLRMHLLPYDDVIAGIVYGVGILLYVVAIAVGTYYSCDRSTPEAPMIDSPGT